MSTYYHIVDDSYTGGDLESLYNQYDEDAESIYMQRWPEAGDLVNSHIYMIHMYDNLQDALEHKEVFGGRILQINGEDLEVVIDQDEFAHPMVYGTIPAYMIKELK